LFTVITPALEYQVLDRPLITGTVQNEDGTEQSSSDLAFVTIRGMSYFDVSLQDESVVVLSATASAGFTYRFSTEILIAQEGDLYLRVFEKDAVSATLNGNFTLADPTMELTIASGTVPTKGHLKVNSEVMAYTKVDSDTITINTAGKYNTTAASHTSGDTAVFTGGAETALPRLHITFKQDDFKLTQAQALASLPSIPKTP